eukprot:12458389-Alexandrium_andersonii.AAC.1
MISSSCARPTQLCQSRQPASSASAEALGAAGARAPPRGGWAASLPGAPTCSPAAAEGPGCAAACPA